MKCILFLLIVVSPYDKINKNHELEFKYLKIGYGEINNKLSVKLNGLSIYFTTGFDSCGNISVSLNNNKMFKCDSCFSNKSIGFTINKINHNLFTPYFKKKLKIGDKLKIQYNNEFVELKITQKQALYHYLTISKNLKNTSWYFFFNDIGYEGGIY